MNAVLRAILDTGTVTDGRSSYPLTFNIDANEGRLLQEVIQEIQPCRTLEIGMAYGISTLFICEALAALPTAARHIVVDPFQTSDWRGVGLRNVQQAGYGRIVEMYEEPSELVLPRMLAAGETIEMAFIDGWHTFDQALVEFYFINRLLPPGGIVVFDDADRPSINKLLRYILTYPSYKVRNPPAPATSTLFGRLRRYATSLPQVSRVVHPEFRQRSWDLGIGGTCVALRKQQQDVRDDVHFQDF